MPLPPHDFARWALAPSAAMAAVAAAAGGFMAGSLAGSFLNVVAHRVPRRETVVFGRSRCPACGATIRAVDNVPVLGWLVLAGRCRDCGSSISARYPLVEAACGALVAALAAAEWIAGQLPVVAATAWLGHALVALTVVAWALLAERGHAVSGITVGIAATASLLGATFVPALAPLRVACGDQTCAAAWPDCLAASLAGLGAGWLAAAGCGGGPRAACCVVGAALGWQAALLAATAAAAIRVLWPRNPAAATLAPVLAVVCWHPLAWVWAGLCRASGAG